ncbi:(d)CMP kinase [Petroclostridium sp. X23]|uniref:(d)CMP kinase n=1 Tax=Petroclostridium sp. X23 TaxID=3045146 RepID=UPI0024AE6796|nr:(d)CMP kinase [Petroclostridium sp. X23]WHH59463.1 (d)CMP kinase [Petroclostridium sp. X23]
MTTIKVAIDGPAGAGKSTIAKIVAKQLGFIYIDTGAMYRAVALKAIKNNINTKEANKICIILENIDINIKHDEDGQVVLLDGEDVTQAIRTPEVSVGASNVAAIPQVRIKLVELQRMLAAQNNVIMDGRDIGTYVLPDADIKIFLTASVEDRARRRYEEMKLKYSDCSFEQVKKDIEYRDKNDSSREFAPLKAAEDAVIIDTTNNDLEQSVAVVSNLIRERLM